MSTEDRLLEYNLEIIYFQVVCTERNCKAVFAVVQNCSLHLDICSLFDKAKLLKIKYLSRYKIESCIVIFYLETKYFNKKKYVF